MFHPFASSAGSDGIKGQAPGGSRQFLSMPWHAAQADGSLREFFIWGATAAMLRNLYAFLSEHHAR